MSSSDWYPMIDSVTPVFLAGARTVLWEDWGAKDIIPSYNKFYYLLKGTFSFVINGRTYCGKPGQLFLLPYNSTQTYHAYRNPSAEKYWIHCNYFCNGKDFLSQLTLPHFIQVPQSEQAQVTAWFTECCAQDSSLPAKLRQKAAMLNLLAYYTQKCSPKMNITICGGSVQKIIEYMEANLEKDITLDDLLAISNFSRAYFVRHFKNEIGYPPMEYIQLLRIDKAKRLLQSTDLTVTEIARQTGFKSNAYLCRIMKKRIGYSPSGYRRSNSLREPS